MSICFAGLTADRILRNLRQQRETDLVGTSSQALCRCTSDHQTARKVATEFGIPSTDHIEILVGSSNSRHAAQSHTAHLWTGVPPEGSLLVYEKDVYLPTPCFCLLLQARELGLIQLCQMLGFYMGTEQITTSSGERITLPPMVTRTELVDYLQTVKGMKGAAPLRKALEFTCEGAASPQETNLQLVLTLPPSYCGFGLKHPTMNGRVKLSPAAMKLYDHEFCRIDLYWSDYDFGLEYQGDEHGLQLGLDYARFFALSIEGKEVLYVAKEQLSSATQMQYIARCVAERTGSKTDGPWWPTEEDTARLIEVILAKRPTTRDVRRSLRQK